MPKKKAKLVRAHCIQSFTHFQHQTRHRKIELFKYLSCMKLQLEHGFDLVLLAPPSRRLEHLLIPHSTGRRPTLTGAPARATGDSPFLVPSCRHRLLDASELTVIRVSAHWADGDTKHSVSGFAQRERHGEMWTNPRSRSDVLCSASWEWELVLCRNVARSLVNSSFRKMTPFFKFFISLLFFQLFGLLAPFFY